MKVKITSIAAAKDLVNRLEECGLRFSVYFGNPSIQQHYVYYHDTAGWHSYYAERTARSTDIKDLSADTVAKDLYRNRKQFNGLFFDVNEGFVEGESLWYGGNIIT